MDAVDLWLLRYEPIHTSVADDLVEGLTEAQVRGRPVPGGPPGSKDDHLDRYIEIWTLVFMQFNRDQSGTLHALPSPSVDTGMGLERIAAVMQKVHSNYEIDLFQALIKSAAQLLQVKDLENNSLRVIADHIRSCAFLIVDGVLPGNEGRGYVLRRIMRRAIRHGNKLGAETPFFYKLAATLAAQMGDAYPELVKQLAQVERGNSPCMAISCMVAGCWCA